MRARECRNDTLYTTVLKAVRCFNSLYVIGTIVVIVFMICIAHVCHNDIGWRTLLSYKEEAKPSIEACQQWYPELVKKGGASGQAAGQELKKEAPRYKVEGIAPQAANTKAALDK